MTTPSDSAANLARKWGVTVRHALYRKTGDWYHQLKRFPGALLDADGFVIFETRDAYRSCAQLRIRQDLNVPQGIKQIPGYVQVVFNGIAHPQKSADIPTYEKALRHREGRSFDVVQTRYERDPKARAACLEHHGYSCAACGMNFVKQYGELGKEFIHVHHLTLLSDSNGKHDIDPVSDLIPVCPNCHAMLHRRNPPLTVQDLRKRIKEAQ